jgi:hypothetical protein
MVQGHEETPEDLTSMQIRKLPVLLALLAMPAGVPAADCASVPAETLVTADADSPAFAAARARLEAWISACGPVTVEARARTEGADAAAASSAVDELLGEVSALAALDPDEVNRRPYHFEPKMIVNGVDGVLLSALLASDRLAALRVLEASAAP